MAKNKSEIVDHSERAHSELGASSASRWLACPSSVHLSEGIEETASGFASEGTCSHTLAEAALVEGKPCSDFIGNEYESHIVTAEMANFTQLYVDYVLDASEGKELSIEERIDLSFIDPRMFGSNDAIVYEPNGELEVIDLKYGMGLEVFPEHNKQLMYYALGAMQGGEYEQVKMTIVQPRVNNPIKSWVVPVSVIEEYADTLRAGVAKVDSMEDLYEVGTHCKFCKAKAICPAQKAKAQEVLKVDFGEFMEVKKTELPKPETLNDFELKQVLDHSKMIKDWIASVNAYALGKLNAGQGVEGYKLIAGRSSRVIPNAKEFELGFEAIYGEELFIPRKLKGIPALEKLIGKKEMAPFVQKIEGKKSLAPNSNKKPALKSNVEEDFGAFLDNKQKESFDDLEF